MGTATGQNTFNFVLQPPSTQTNNKYNIFDGHFY